MREQRFDCTPAVKSNDLRVEHFGADYLKGHFDVEVSILELLIISVKPWIKYLNSLQLDVFRQSCSCSDSSDTTE